MKIVLSWVFDHLNALVSNFDPHDIAQRLTEKTVEIESVVKVQRTFESFAFAHVIEEKNGTMRLIDHYGRNIEVKKEIDCFVNRTYLIVHDPLQNKWRFAHTKDVGSTRDFLLPSFYVEDTAVDIRQLMPEEEYILIIENNAVTHRGDLWNHRGFAREIAALYGLTLKPIESLVINKKLNVYPEAAPVMFDSPFSITIEQEKMCQRFAGLYLSSIQNRASSFSMAQRLSLVDCKSINFLVDATNYVLFDIGQPIHIYDSESLTEKRIVIRAADNQSTITLLDGEQLTLSSQDVIVADGLTPIALAGIMGGEHSKVTEKTNAVFIESAAFNAFHIQKSSQIYGKKTESALRFAKNIDPNQNIFGITRFLMLLEQHKVNYKSAATIQSVGTLISEGKIIVVHEHIEKKLGILIDVAQVKAILTALGFEVIVQPQGTYLVIVPTFRSAEDIKIAEDIIEEIGRMYGYSTIHYTLPMIATSTKLSVEAIKKIRALKEILSFGFCMKEVQSYSLFDEQFLQKVGYDPQNTLTLKNPYSVNQRRLLSTLVMGLVKTVAEHVHFYDSLRFYEIAKIWTHNGDFYEQPSLAGIFFEKKKSFSFYEGKQFLDRLFDRFNIKVEYQATTEDSRMFLYDEIHSAFITYENNIIGYCGLISSVKSKLWDKGDAFIFELNYEKFLLPFIIRYKEISKFPSVKRDFTLFLKKQELSSEIKTYIQSIDTRITGVEIIDFFKKEEWDDARAVTFRCTIQDNEKTLESGEVEELYKKIHEKLIQRGMEIR